MLGIVNYGMGNLRSVQKAIERVGGSAAIVDSADAISTCDRLILPGVGAFADAMDLLRQRSLLQPVLDYAHSGRPFLGICLGMQLMLDHSEETISPSDPPVAGLGLIPGSVRRFQFAPGPDGRTPKVPHMGWNAIKLPCNHPLTDGIEHGDHAYFVHGYFCDPTNDADRLASTDYSGDFCSMIACGNLLGCQFHPEKSQAVGLRILANFLSSTSQNPS
ncbi:MAG: imidazole glycerol phosphate synthase subunit HisH [Phycisphaeraceae bacterium]